MEELRDFPSQPEAGPESRTHLIKPLERLKLVPPLDGSVHWQRPNAFSLSCGIRNDIDGVQRWLAEYKAGSSIHHARRLAIEKLLLWCVVERGHALAELSFDEIELFCLFLAEVEPRERWMMFFGNRRASPNWRPFKTTLNAAAIAHLLMLVRLYLDWASIHGLDAVPPGLGGIDRLTKNLRSSLHSNNRPLPINHLPLSSWLVLGQYFPSASGTLADLQDLAVLQALFYGAITVEQIFKLRDADLRPHYQGEHLAAWEIPSGDKRSSTVFSVGLLTSTLTLLMARRANERLATPLQHPGLFGTGPLRVREVLERAKHQAIVNLNALGSDESLKAFSSFTLAQIRGAIITNIRQEGHHSGLAEVFSWTFLSNFPATQQYFNWELMAKTERRIELALEMTQRINEAEMTHLGKLLDLQAKASMGRLDPIRRTTNPFTDYSLGA